MTITKEKIEVVTSVERRRRWTPEEKGVIAQGTYNRCIGLKGPMMGK